MKLENGDHDYLLYGDEGSTFDERVKVEIVNGHVASLDGVMLDEGEPTIAEFMKLYPGKFCAVGGPATKRKAAK